jgi:hypothetical protein
LGKEVEEADVGVAALNVQHECGDACVLAAMLTM